MGVMAVRSWAEMRDWQVGLLERSTGETLATWNARVAEQGFADEAGLRDWLKQQGVEGYAQMLLVFEAFGYPDFFTRSADELIENQYADRPALRPIFDVIIAALPALGETTVQTRKTYVSLLTPRRTFAIVAATTRTRVDLGLRLPGREPGGRLLAAKSLGNETINVRIGLTTVDEVDAEVHDWLERVYQANC